MKPHLFSNENPIKIGTRGSDLALVQAHEVKNLLMRAHGLDANAISIKLIKTTGDIVQDRPLSEIGGKGLFTKEIEQALIEGEIDIAVHSSKDMPTVLPDGLVLDVFLEREDVRDAFISNEAENLGALSHGATIGSASLRRQAQLKRFRSDFNVIIFRGNVQTRLRKLNEGQADATLLAAAGLSRLKMTDIIADYLDPDIFLPACAQGAIGIETRGGDDTTHDFIMPLHDSITAAAIHAERAFLKVLDGSCRTPIAGIAKIDSGKLIFKGEVLRPDGSESFDIEGVGNIDDAIAIGEEAGLRLKSRLSADFLESLHQR
ncbi:MAG: hydroxymethylbilane synthase [Hyphomicrobiales bacterium]